MEITYETPDHGPHLLVDMAPIESIWARIRERGPWTGIVLRIRSGDAGAAAAEIQAGYPEVRHSSEVPTNED